MLRGSHAVYLVSRASWPIVNLMSFYYKIYSFAWIHYIFFLIEWNNSKRIVFPWDVWMKYFLLDVVIADSPGWLEFGSKQQLIVAISAKYSQRMPNLTNLLTKSLFYFFRSPCCYINKSHSVSWSWCVSTMLQNFWTLIAFQRFEPLVPRNEIRVPKCPNHSGGLSIRPEVQSR